MRIWLPWLFPGLALGFQVKRTGDGIPLRWPDGAVLVALDEAGSDDVPGRADIGAMHGALAPWNAIAASPVSMQPVESAQGPVDEPQAPPPTAHIAWWPDWHDQPDALAVTVLTYDVDTGDILGAEIRINDEVDWTIVGGASEDSNRFDLQNTIAHEVGHLLGLAHSDEPGATMYATSAPGEIRKRDLDLDDLAGFDHLYGAATTPDGDIVADRAPGCSMASGPEKRGAPLALLFLALVVGARRRLWMLLLLAAPDALSEPGAGPPPETLLARADRIVVGRVLGSESLWVGDTIHTDTTVEVGECLRGPCPARIVVRQPGGEVGTIGHSVEGRVPLRAGEIVVLLLRNRADGTMHPVGMQRGVARLDGDGIVARHSPGAAGEPWPSLVELRRRCAQAARSDSNHPGGHPVQRVRPDQRRHQRR